MSAHSVGYLRGIVTDAPTTRRAPPLPPGERRSAIIEAVLPLVRQRGSAVTSRDLALAAGVSEGTIFNVFDDKDELLDAVVMSVIDPGPVNEAIAALDESLSFDEQLVAATELLQRRTTEIWRLLSKLVERHPPQRGPIGEHPALVTLMGRHADELAVPPADAARTLQAFVLALTHPMLATEPAPAAVVVDRFLHGCANPGGTE